MRREDLEHVIRAAAAVTNQYELAVIGSQSILGAFPNAPDELLRSVEADLYPRHAPDLADLIDAAIGEEAYMSPGSVTEKLHFFVAEYEGLPTA